MPWARSGLAATQAPSRRPENEVPMQTVNRNLLTIQFREKELATWSTHRADSRSDLRGM